MLIKGFTDLDSYVDSLANSGTGNGHHPYLDDIDLDFDVVAKPIFLLKFGVHRLF